MDKVLIHVILDDAVILADLQPADLGRGGVEQDIELEREPVWLREQCGLQLQVHVKRPEAVVGPNEALEAADEGA